MPLKDRAKALQRRLERYGWFVVLRDAGKDWADDDAPDHAAAVAYYALFSLAPLLLIAVAVAGFFFDQAAAREQMLSTAGSLIGEQGREGLRVMLENASRPGAGILATILGLVALLFGASNVFAHLKKALNDVWEVEERSDLSWKHKVRERLLSMGMVVGVGFLLLVSLVLGAVLSALSGYLQGLVPGFSTGWLVVQTLVSLAVSTFVFGALFKVLPNVEIGWRQVARGAFLTAVLFEAGRILLGLYLGRSAMGSSFGAAGSVVIILVWMYYSGLIFFFGAELTQVLARRRGEPVEPDEYAVRIGDRTVPRGQGGATSATRGRQGRRGGGPMV